MRRARTAWERRFALKTRECVDKVVRISCNLVSHCSSHRVLCMAQHGNDSLHIQPDNRALQRRSFPCIDVKGIRVRGEPAMQRIMALVLVATTVAIQARGDEVDPRLQAVRARYAETMSSIRTLWSRTQLTIDAPDVVATYDLATTIDWAFDGKRFHYHQHGFRPDGQPGRKRWMSSDGKTVWFLEYSDSGLGDDVEWVLTRPFATFGDIEFRNEEGVGQFLGLSSLYCRRMPLPDSIGSMLESQAARFIGVEQINEHSCDRVLLGEVRCSANSNVRRIEAWYDPSASGLPRRIRTIGIDGGGNSYTADHDVLEFQEVSIGVGEGTLRFPRLMRSDWQTFELTEVLINQPLADDLFRPAVPNDVTLVDLSNRVEVEAYHNERMGEIAAQTGTETANHPGPRLLSSLPAPGISAAPRQLPWSRTSIAVGVVLLMLATFVLIRRSRQSS